MSMHAFTIQARFASEQKVPVVCVRLCACVPAIARIHARFCRSSLVHDSGHIVSRQPACTPETGRGPMLCRGMAAKLRVDGEGTVSLLAALGLAVFRLGMLSYGLYSYGSTISLLAGLGLAVKSRGVQRRGKRWHVVLQHVTSVYCLPACEHVHAYGCAACGMLRSLCCSANPRASERHTAGAVSPRRAALASRGDVQVAPTCQVRGVCSCVCILWCVAKHRPNLMVVSACEEPNMTSAIPAERSHSVYAAPKSLSSVYSSTSLSSTGQRSRWKLPSLLSRISSDLRNSCIACMHQTWAAYSMPLSQQCMA